MLTFTDKQRARDCQGYRRRDFLKLGALGLGGLALPGLLARHAAAAGAPTGIRDKAVVLLFLQGGPSHIETFDPKMSAPSEYRCIFGDTPTNLPGVRFGSHFSRMAKIADKLAIVRSFQSKNGGHTYESVTTASNPLKAAMSAIYARIAGLNNKTTGIPNNTLILPEAVKAGVKLGSNFETGALPTLTQAGSLGQTFAAFNPAGGGNLKQNMELRLEPDRLRDRRHLLARLDRIRRDADASGMLEGVDTYQQQAFDIIMRGVGEAFDLSKEDPRTIEKYDTTKLFRLDEVTRWHDMARASNLLGHQMLLARRLVEAGCGFVTVSDCGWDMHSNSNSPKGLGAMNWLGPQTDHAVAAFVEDIHARGLQDKVLLIVTGEMGRSPRINNNGGREHYGELTPLIFAGGGLKMGQVIGQSDANCTVPNSEAYQPEHLMATVMNYLFDPAELRLQPNLPREILTLVEKGKPIRELF
ncbi:MAG: DUF1501 domain-containing protein [Phycisphaeraceae bacterium]